MESILTSIKKLLGIAEDYTHFDADIIMHINTVLMDLNGLGVGPSTGFVIEDSTKTWIDFISNPKDLQAIKSYIYLRVKLLFDSSTLNSSTISSMERQIEKFEWLLTVAAENKNPDVISELKALIAEIESENVSLKEINAGLESVNQNLQNDVDMLTSDNNNLRAEKNELQVRVEELENASPSDEVVVELERVSGLWKWFEDSFVKPNYFNSICKSKEGITYVPALDLSAITDASSMFYDCNGMESIGDLDLSNATTLKLAFYDCDNLKTVGNLKTNSCTDFNSAFYYSKNLTEIGAFDTRNGTKFDYMFNNCRKLVSIPDLDFTNATSVTDMFDGCVALEEFGFVSDTIGASGVGFELEIPCSKLSSNSLLSLLNGCIYESPVTLLIDSSLFDKFTDEHWYIVSTKAINIS